MKYSQHVRVRIENPKERNLEYQSQYLDHKFITADESEIVACNGEECEINKEKGG